MKQPLTVASGKKIRLADFCPSYTNDIKNKKNARQELNENLAILSEMGYRLYAENRRALLLVLQGMDTSGKDGTIRHVMRGFNPQSCQVTSFKQPSIEELHHDFLWRIAKAVPGKGNVGIFNRSHYEDVLVVRVHQLVPKKEWETRYERINAFEKLLTEGGTTVVKVFLHIDKQEQRRRLQSRLDDPKKRWKFDAGDLRERLLWDQYQRAYEDALTLCNTKTAPWYIVPADHKWYRNLIVSRILCKTLKKMAPQYPPPAKDLDKVVVE
jgi:PPK2 family polyphosphate:nucleotide phosphotransferase